MAHVQELLALDLERHAAEAAGDMCRSVQSTDGFAALSDAHGSPQAETHNL